MIEDILIQVGIVFGILFSIVCACKAISHLRKAQTNTELWATVFEGFTHKTMDLDLLKQPEVYAEKKVKKAGQGKNPLIPDASQ